MHTSYSDFVDAGLTRRIIGCAMEVHRELGPGLLESVYRECLMRELASAGLPFVREVKVPITYKGEELDCGFGADIVVNDSVVVELKAVEGLLPIHEAQLLTYLKLMQRRVGLLLNFNSTSLKHGIRRLAR
jgi:GxxExxY protein